MFNEAPLQVGDGAASFPFRRTRSHLKENKVSRSEETRKVEYAYNSESVPMLFSPHSLTHSLLCLTS